MVTYGRRSHSPLDYHRPHNSISPMHQNPAPRPLMDVLPSHRPADRMRRQFPEAHRLPYSPRVPPDYRDDRALAGYHAPPTDGRRRPRSRSPMERHKSPSPPLYRAPRRPAPNFNRSVPNEGFFY